MSTLAPGVPGCLVLLNGFPGVGKLTIARSLQSKLGNEDTRLIDNHLIIDPAEAVHPGRGYQHKVFRDRLRHVLFDELKTISGHETVLIMTCSLGANVEDAAIFAEHLEIARCRGIQCYVFTLSCEKEQQFSRLQSPDRALGDKSKLAQPAVLEDLLSNNKILDPHDPSLVYELGTRSQLQHNSLNTTELKPEESALCIFNIIAFGKSKG